MSTTRAPLRIAGRDLGEHRHVCALFNTPEEEYRVLLPFIQDGLGNGERVILGVERKRRTEQHQRLRDAGVDIDAAQSNWQLELRNSEETYLPSGEFDQDAMLALISNMLETSAALGFPRTRLIAHPECVFETWRNTINFLQYEARLNQLLPHGEDAVVCLYDCQRLSAGVLLDILRTHPLVIFGGGVQENPFYLSPEEFLRELRGRTEGDQGAERQPPCATA
jgi:hypothetical protein